MRRGTTRAALQQQEILPTVVLINPPAIEYAISWTARLGEPFAARLADGVNHPAQISPSPSRILLESYTAVLSASSERWEWVLEQQHLVTNRNMLCAFVGATLHAMLNEELMEEELQASEHYGGRACDVIDEHMRHQPPPPSWPDGFITSCLRARLMHAFRVMHQLRRAAGIQVQYDWYNTGAEFNPAKMNPSVTPPFGQSRHYTVALCFCLPS